MGLRSNSVLRLVAAGVALAAAAAACGLDLVGRNPATSGLDSGDDSAGPAPADAARDADPIDGAGSGDAPPADALADALADGDPADALVDAGLDVAVGIPATCLEILTRNPVAPSAIYTVDPDGADAGAPPFQVLCDMTTAGGGWTLVGRELAGSTGQFRFLDVDTQNPVALTGATASALLGKRFIGKYTQVWIAWDVANYIRFTRPAGFDLFANLVNTSVGITATTTSDSTLAGWIASAGGAKLCVASQDPNVRPGDTSWAVKPSDDNNFACGCNSGSWSGRGAYYGGTVNGQQTACTGFGGGWAGVKDNGVAKGGITPAYETRIWIR